MKHLQLFSIFIVIFAAASVNAQVTWTWTYIPNYFGIAFSPYVMGRNPDGTYPYWNSYSVNDIKQMLTIASANHYYIATYSMGVNQWNVNSPFDQADSNGLIARAAAQVNKARASAALSVAVGVYQQDDPTFQDKEIQNAFAAIQDANTIYSGTAWALTLTNEYVVDETTGQKVLDMINNNKVKANGMGVKIGTRIHTCGGINGGPLQIILTKIAQAADFIMCNIYPGPGITNATMAVENVNYQYLDVSKGLLKANPKLEIPIGETGWPSEGKSFNNDASANTVANLVAFWNGMRTWSRTNKVKVHMFEAFDEPWKGDYGSMFPGESHYGWWYRKSNTEAVYIEKATGKQFM